ncbi:MAG: FUSC family protein [Candidatus Nanopelagicales bacterium]
MAISRDLILRRAARAAVVIPATNVLLVQVLDDPRAGFYAGFAGLTMLVFADFGGPLLDRFAAYLVAGAGGAGAIVLGHLVSANALLAALTGLLVGAGLAFVSLLRGYIGAGASTVQLGFILAATAGPTAPLDAQLRGWAAGALTASLAAVLMWPARGSSELRRSVATGVDAAADLVAARWLDGDRVAAAAQMRAARMVVREEYQGRLTRPGAASSRDRALLELIDELNRLGNLLTWGQEAPGTSSALDRELAGNLVGTLRACAACLNGAGPAPDPAEVAEAREAHMRQSVAYAEMHLADDQPAALVGHIRSSFPLRLSAISTEFIANDTRGAVRLERRQVHSAEGRQLPGNNWDTSPLELLAAHSTLDSPWFRTGLRSGLGLAVAILVALQVGADNAYWVVLGTLSMLRFDAMGTGRTAAQAVLGTAGGSLLAAGTVSAVEGYPLALWLLLIVAVFAAAYTPNTTSYLIAQGAFSGCLIIMSSLSGANPLHSGLVRVTDIALGALVSVTVGFLLWPRGARAQVRRTLAEALERGGAFALASTSRLASRLAGETTDGPDLSGLRKLAVQSCTRADEAIDLAVAQRGPEPINAARWARGASISHHFVEAADVMSALSDPPPAGPRTARVGAALVALGGRTMADLVVLQAKLLSSGRPEGDLPPIPAVSDIIDDWVQGLDAAIMGSLALWPRDDGAGAVRLVWSSQWQIYLAWLAACADTVTESDTQEGIPALAG